MMLKVSPFFKNNHFIKQPLRNKKNLITSSLVALSLLGASINGCSKMNKPIIEDKFEKSDTLKTKTGEENKGSIEIVIDDSLEVIEHIIVL